MKHNPEILRIVGLISSTLLSACCLTAAPQPRKILFFSKSSGYEHSAIKKSDGQLSAAEEVLAKLAKDNNFEFTFSKDGGLFTPENIPKYDAFFFYTTGDLTQPGTDKNPPMSKEGKAAFLAAIKAGKGFIGTHSATDTFHSPNYAGSAAEKFSNDKLPDAYIEMIGGEFIQHGSQQKAHQICVDDKFPGMSAVTADFGPLEEWYSLKNFAPNLHVLLVQDTSSMKKDGGNHCYDRPPYPATWAHMYGKGRVFYTNMGHREDVWTNPVFQQVLAAGINWAVGNVDADVSPNMDKVAADANQLPSPPQ